MHWRAQEALNRQGPRLLMLASVVAVIALVAVGPRTTVPGYAEVSPVRIASLEAGRVAEVPVLDGALVSAGDVVGILDDAPIQGRIRVLRAELERHGATLAGVEREAQATLLEAQAEREDTSAQLRAAGEALAVAQERRDARARQVELGLAARDDLAVLDAEVAELKGDVDLLQTRLEHQLDALALTRQGIEGDGDAPAPALLEQVRAVGVVQEELALLEERRAAMTMRAPIDARVGVVHYRRGEVLPAQETFAELLPLETTTVVACVPEKFGIFVRAGTPAELWPADGGAPRVGLVVDVVGLVSEAPDRCKQRPNEIGWVRPVRIAVDGGGLVPGQRFDVTFGEAPDPEVKL